MLLNILRVLVGVGFASFGESQDAPCINAGVNHWTVSWLHTTYRRTW